MDNQEVLQSMVGKTIKFIEPFIIGDEIQFIEITFEDDTVVDVFSTL